MHEPLNITGKVILHRNDFSHDAPPDLWRKPLEVVSRFGEKVYLISHNYPTLTSYRICLKNILPVSQCRVVTPQISGELTIGVAIMYSDLPSIAS
jgi:hypothetical protein